MLTVWCVLVGDKYTDRDAQILQAMVGRNTAEPHRFICLSDRSIVGVETFIPPEVYPGWWSKLLLFQYAAGPCVYIDLDCVVLGDVATLAAETLTLPANWAQSGHGGCQSSVMAWNGNGLPYLDISLSFCPAELEAPAGGNCGAYQGLWGDQEYITRELGAPGEGHIEPMAGVYSYKYHCRQGPPDDAVVVAFHGEPKPDNVGDSWVQRARCI